MDFPTIHTNFWDTIIAVPLIVIVTQLFKFFPIRRQYYPLIATILGYIIAIFYSHRHDLWAALFMGSFYGVAAVGTYSSLKTSWIAFKTKRQKKLRSTSLT